MKNLKDFSKEEYTLLLKSGMFWELYPEATGDYSEDVVSCKEYCNVETKEERKR